MSDIAIKVENLSKFYHIGAKKSGSLRGTLEHSFNKLIGKKDAIDEAEEFWALKDISFEIKKGEAVGIIGRNGAGKSTLLKILSRITEPTTGKITINGRVASLLEVGTGFHPELTGRENIFMNGAILGMKQVEIKRKFDEIVDFSGIEKFIDTPVKHYSSGMYVRLAFAVAAHLEPEILIIDEVLAVGDAEFQKKCLGKMNDVSSKEGRTILFVSHAMSAVKQLCRKAFLLSKGQIEKLGSSEEVAAYYLSGSVEKASSQTWSDIQTAPGNEVVKLLSVSALSALNQPYIDIDSGIIFEFRFHNFLTGKNIDFTIEVVNSDGVLMFHNGIILSQNQDSEIGVYEVTLSIPPNLLNAGRYFVHVFWGENCSYLIHRIDEVIAFDIENTIPKNAEHKIQGLPGVIRPQLKWEKKFLSKEVLI